jgi:TonB family protein
MTTLLALAMLAIQFVRNSPNTPVITAPVVRFQLPPDINECHLTPPFKMNVTVSLTVGVDGNAHDARIVHSSGNACVDKREVYAASRYRFSPALKESKPVPMSIKMTMNVSSER